MPTLREAILVGVGHTSALMPVCCCPAPVTLAGSVAGRPATSLYLPGPLPVIIGL
jgi:hypothetical protein